MNKKMIFLSIFIIWLIVVSCNLPVSPVNPTSAAPPAAIVVAITVVVTMPGISSPESTANTPEASSTITAGPPATQPEPTATITPSPTLCVPNVVPNVSLNVRAGPGSVYDIVGAISPNGSAEVAGKNADRSWWYIKYPGGIGGHGWVSGAFVSANCIPDTLAIIAAPPTPTSIPPTPKPTSAPDIPVPPLTRNLKLQTPFMTGSDVLLLQNQLLALGYALGDADGIFGPKTDAAVRAFQSSNGLAVDGIVGKLTWAALFK